MRLLLFGPVRARLAVDRLEFPAANDMSADELWSQILGRYPELKPLRPTLRLARGGEFLPANARLHPQDEIALIPPVSGG